MTKISVLIPVYNERAFVNDNLPELIQWLNKTFDKNYEVVIVENGSTDGTYEALSILAEDMPQLQLHTLKKASFGNAVRTAIMKAKGDIGILLNADWLDRDFIKNSIKECDTHDLVIGSKLLDPTLDSRPLFRKIASKSLTFLLKKSFGFEYSDSHGLKAFRLKKVQPLIRLCTLNEIIESELLLRAQAAHLNITEIPVAIEEIRAPRISFVKRIHSMGRELITLHAISNKIQQK